MSATRFRSHPHEPAGPATPESRSPSAAVRWKLFWLASVLAAAWSLTLLVMAWQTSNPVVVSPDQLLNSDVVVVARRVAAGDDHVRVERVLHGAVAERDELHVRNLKGVGGMADDQSYLLALSQFQGDYVVTTLAGQRAAPLVYPLSPDTIEAAKSIIRNHL
jgi:hypothetical protein